MTTTLDAALDSSKALPAALQTALFTAAQSLPLYDFLGDAMRDMGQYGDVVITNVAELWMVEDTGRHGMQIEVNGNRRFNIVIEEVPRD